MKTKMKPGEFAVVLIIALAVAIYTLMPFFLVVINVFKSANSIVADPISFAGASFG